MIKEANLISVVAAHSSVTPELLTQYLQYHSIKIKVAELDDLRMLVNQLMPLTKESAIFDKYFVGYNIPLISKEFDLLRIGQRYIVNIELKSIADIEKIKKQLIRNKYYLSFLNKELHFFTFASKTKKLFALDQSDNLIEVPFQYLIEILVKQAVNKVKDIDGLFNPSNYLVSPFNSTDQFIQGKYFLTVRQENIKNEVINLFAVAGLTMVAIKGKAGTGKSLLTYDIAKDYLAQNKSVLLIHIGILNSGHRKLIDWYKWKIIPAREFYSADFSLYDVIIIDEAQRLYPAQLQHLVNKMKVLGGKCIFSYDGAQCLQKTEINNRLDQQIEMAVTEKPYELTDKIRSNKEIADFINCLFDKKRPIVKGGYPNVDLNYFSSYQDAKNFLNQMRQENWKVINYTPSTRTTLPYELHRLPEEGDNAHTVIGQEYDQVIGVIDEYFFYKAGKLSTKNYGIRPYYHPTKMLFQIVSRTRLKLGIVVVNNKEVLEHCLSILNLSKKEAMV